MSKSATVRKSKNPLFGTWFVQILGHDVRGFDNLCDAKAYAACINAKTADMAQAEVRRLYSIAD